MSEKSSTFKIVIIGIFIAFGVLGIIALAGFRGGGGGEANRTVVTLWGTLDRSLFLELDNRHRERTDSSLMVNYVQKNSFTFEDELINALAAGSGPDAILAPPGFIYKHRDKVYQIPYESLSESFVKQNFIEASELFLTSGGALAVPFSVDPVVLYWNRDILSSAGIAVPPATWNEVVSAVPNLSVVDANYNVIQGAIAMGEYDNIGNAKEILSTLLLQVGNQIVVDNGGRPSVTLVEKFGNERPAESAISFYTNFSDPAKNTYSWNRALPEAQNMFLAGDLAFYIGLASEFNEINRKNPNLNFGVSFVPQLEESRRRTTYGLMRGVAIMRNSRALICRLLTLPVLMCREMPQNCQGLLR
jgi:ABC-type glycerol-3-phosphate transport system substrate-binding protein